MPNLTLNELLPFVLTVAAVYAVFAVLGMLWRMIGNRRLRSAAGEWLEAGDWAAFHARYETATPAQRVVLLACGQGRPELAMLYARALRGAWAEAAAASEALRFADVLPPVVEAAAREQLQDGGLRGDLLRALRPGALAPGDACGVAATEGGR